MGRIFSLTGTVKLTLSLVVIRGSPRVNVAVTIQRLNRSCYSLVLSKESVLKIT
jgi:hypothetical protein